MCAWPSWLYARLATGMPPRYMHGTLVVMWNITKRVSSYSISYYNTNIQCFSDSNIITGISSSETMYTLTYLQEATEYSITLTAILSDGETESSFMATTMAAVPSAAPTSVSVSEVTSFSITIQWGAVECIHHNGDITGYLVQYRIQGNENTQTKHVSGVSATSATISNLMSSTTYSVEVAAVTSAGTGVFSPVIMNMTQTVTAPGQPSVSVDSTAATSISISWSVPSDSVVDSYVVMWQKATSEASTILTVTITDASTSYTLRGIESDAVYSITVTATNSAGSAASIPILVSTSDEVATQGGDNTAATVGGVLGTALILSLTVIVIVVLLKNCGGHSFSGMQRRHPASAVDIPSSTNEAYELSKFSEEAVYEEPDSIHTSGRKAFHTVKETGGKDPPNPEYEIVATNRAMPSVSPSIPHTSHTSQPTSC